MADLLFGAETEYAITGVSPDGPIGHDEILERLMEQARRTLIHLPDLCSPSGIYLQNGSRFYVDCGSHPEIGTPECIESMGCGALHPGRSSYPCGPGCDGGDRVSARHRGPMLPLQCRLLRRNHLGRARELSASQVPGRVAAADDSAPRIPAHLYRRRRLQSSLARARVHALPAHGAYSPHRLQRLHRRPRHLAHPSPSRSPRNTAASTFCAARVSVPRPRSSSRPASRP